MIKGWEILQLGRDSVVYFAALRPRTLLIALAAVGSALVLSAARGCFDQLLAVLTILTAVSLQILSNLTNDLFDFRLGVDTQERLGPERLLASGKLEERWYWRAVGVFLVLVILSGCTLVWVGGPLIAVLGVLALMAAIFYTAPPISLGKRGLGELFVFVFFGPVSVLGTYFLQCNSLSLEVWLWAICHGILATAVLVVNNHRDLEQDLIAGKRTLAVRLGSRFSELEYRVLILIDLLLVAMLARLTDRYLLLVALPVGIFLLVCFSRRSASELNQQLADTVRFQFLHLLLLLL